MNIAVITYDYPDSHRSVFPFVKALVDEWGYLGHEVTVISPFSLTRTRSLIRYDEQDHPESVRVLRPRIISLSYRLKFRGQSLTDWIHGRAVNRTLNNLITKPDVIYCHFWKESVFAYDYARKNNLPLIVASGESEIPSFLASEPFLSKCSKVERVICVSSKNLRESVELGLTTEDKCIVLPNAIDNKLFKVSDQTELRKSLGITDHDFVVAFVGWFNERKGSKRVSEALKMINNQSIKVLFIGAGSEDPDCQGIVFKGTVSHNEIPKYLNCADVFVLPSLREGCCNAIVEAMACGLPVISSDREFNWDILDERNSILIDPYDVKAIADAIKQLYNDRDRRMAMRESALRKAEGLTIASRAQKIIDVIGSSHSE